MHLKKSYHIAINVCSRKSATTFGDLPDCLVFKKLRFRCKKIFVTIMFTKVSGLFEPQGDLTMTRDATIESVKTAQ